MELETFDARTVLLLLSFAHLGVAIGLKLKATRCQVFGGQSAFGILFGTPPSCWFPPGGFLASS